MKLIEYHYGKFYEIEVIPIGENQVGFIHASRPNAKSEPQWMPEACSSGNLGHATCILPNGHLVSFGYDHGASVKNSNFLQRKLEIGLPGQIAYNGVMGSRYSQHEFAIKGKIRSSVLIIDASPHQVIKFSDYWKNEAGTFTKFSRNCSTFSYQAFRSADLVRFSMTPIMTPKILYDLLLETCKRRQLKVIEKTGFMGVKAATQEKNDLLIANEIK